MIDVAELAGCIDQGLRDELRSRPFGLYNAFQQGREALDVLLPNGDAGRVAMAPVCDQRRVAFFQALIDVEIGNTPPGAFADALPQADQDHRPAVTVDQTGGDDADDAGMPLSGSEDKSAFFLLAGGLIDVFQDFGNDHFFHRLPLAVAVLQPLRQLPGLFEIFREQKPDGVQGRPDASGGIDPRNEAKRGFAGIDDLIFDAADFLQGNQAGPPVFGQQFKPDFREDPVFVDQGGDIPDRSQRDQVQVLP